MSGGPSLKLLHSPGSLVASKLASLRSISTAELLESLKPGTPGALRVKADGTVMNGNHRIAVLLERGVDVHALPREALGPNAGRLGGGE